MNPRKPTELKKLQGTYNVTREKQYDSADVKIAKVKDVIFEEGTKLSCPKSLTETYVKRYWKTLTNNLIALRVLSPQDLTEVESLCKALQDMRYYMSEREKYNVLDPEYDFLDMKYERAFNRFEKLSSKYFISPVARQKMALDNLNIQKTAQEVQKNDDAVSGVLSRRKERRI